MAQLHHFTHDHYAYIQNGFNSVKVTRSSASCDVKVQHKKKDLQYVMSVITLSYQRTHLLRVEMT